MLSKASEKAQERMKAHRVDENQQEIVAAFRRCGASVQHLHEVGQGCPDILVGLRGCNLLVEIKNGDAPLNPVERDWHAAWRGQVAIVRSVEEAVKLCESAS